MTCDWPIDTTCLPDAPDEAALVIREAAIELASSILWALSGRQFGACPVIARPCPQSCAMPVYSGQWRTTSCGCAVRCSRAAPSVVHLPGPVGEVLTVAVDGINLAPSEYVLEGEYLYRADGTAWPAQDLARPNGADNTWSVTYTRGHPVPRGVGRLTGILAAEFVNACTGGKCRLPRNVESVSRRGVSYQMVDPAEIYQNGKTGLSEVDLWLSAVNPNAIMQAPRVR